MFLDKPISADEDSDRNAHTYMYALIHACKSLPAYSTVYVFCPLVFIYF